MIPSKRRRIFFVIPICVIIVIGVGFWAMLQRMGSGAFDPHTVNIPALGRNIPDFSAPGLMPGEAEVTSDALRHNTKPVLINFFASWCVPCISEMPELVKLKHDVTIWGIAYKDKPENARALVTQSGFPYQRTGQDEDGRLGIDMGISGVPESFLIMPGGRIVWHDAAPLTDDTVKNVLLPLLDAER